MCTGTAPAWQPHRPFRVAQIVIAKALLVQDERDGEDAIRDLEG